MLLTDVIHLEAVSLPMSPALSYNQVTEQVVSTINPLRTGRLARAASVRLKR